MPPIKPREVTFLELRNSVLCSECELISYNNTAQCLACGSRAVLSLSHVLGSLRGEQTTRIVAEEPLKSVIQMPQRPVQQSELPSLAAFGRDGVGVSIMHPLVPSPMPVAESAGATATHCAMRLVVERAYRLSRCGGAAVAAHRDGRMLCEARMGEMAPSLGSEVGAGISGMSLSTRRTLRCDLAEDDPRVDAAACRSVGAKSVIAAPITNLERVLGLVAVLSPQAYAFADRDVAVVQWLAGMMAVAFTSSAGLAFASRSTTRCELPPSRLP